MPCQNLYNYDETHVTVHLALWIKDAPVIGQNAPAEVQSSTCSQT